MNLEELQLKSELSHLWEDKTHLVLDLRKLTLYHQSHLIKESTHKLINKKAKGIANLKEIMYLRLQTDTVNQAYPQETEESVEEEFKQLILQKKTRIMVVSCKV